MKESEEIIANYLAIEAYLKIKYNYKADFVFVKLDELNNIFLVIFDSNGKMLTAKPVYNVFSEIDVYIIKEENSQLHYVPFYEWRIIEPKKGYVSGQELLTEMIDYQMSLPEGDPFKRVLKAMINLIIRENWHYYKHMFVKLKLYSFDDTLLYDN